jgi:hypothetical protein
MTPSSIKVDLLLIFQERNKLKEEKKAREQQELEEQQKRKQAYANAMRIWEQGGKKGKVFIPLLCEYRSIFPLIGTFYINVGTFLILFITIIIYIGTCDGEE